MGTGWDGMGMGKGGMRWVRNGNVVTERFLRASIMETASLILTKENGALPSTCDERDGTA
jgi:hypothetical protein